MGVYKKLRNAFIYISVKHMFFRIINYLLIEFTILGLWEWFGSTGVLLTPVEVPVVWNLLMQNIIFVT